MVSVEASTAQADAVSIHQGRMHQGWMHQGGGQVLAVRAPAEVEALAEVLTVLDEVERAKVGLERVAAAVVRAMKVVDSAWVAVVKVLTELVGAVLVEVRAPATVAMADGSGQWEADAAVSVLAAVGRELVGVAVEREAQREAEVGKAAQRRTGRSSLTFQLADQSPSRCSKLGTSHRCPHPRPHPRAISQTSSP